MKNQIKYVISLIFFLNLSMSSISASIVYEVMDVSFIGEDEVIIRDINHSGQMVGEYKTDSGNYNSFYWDKKTGLTNLSTIGLESARAINDSGQVVGSTTTGHAAIWSYTSNLLDMGDLDQLITSGIDINNSGQIAGNYFSNEGEMHAFTWDKNSGFINIGHTNDIASNAIGISDSGKVFGNCLTGFEKSPFMGDRYVFSWEKDTGTREIVDFGSDYVGARGINNQGKIVGEAVYDDYTNSKGYISDGLNTLFFESPDGKWAWTNGINDQGQVVGNILNDGFNPFLWDEINGLRSLQDLVAPDIGILTDTNDIFNGGIISVNMEKDGEYNPYTYLKPVEQTQEVPEPLTFVLFILGFLGFRFSSLKKVV